jgi:tetratricopeptide (TPR) repeat protein
MANGLQVITLLILASCSQSVLATDEWLGKDVFVKDTAVAMVGTKVVDKDEMLAFPALVEDVNGEWLWLGRAWVKKSDCMLIEDAFAYFDERVSKTPTSANALTKRAIIWRQKGEPRKAIEDLDEAIRIDPQFAMAHRSRGYTVSGRLKGAR